MCELAGVIFGAGLLFYLGGVYACWRAGKNMEEADKLLRELREESRRE